MIDEAWFETTGRMHLRQLAYMIERTIVLGQLRGLKPGRINGDEIMRAYRGEPPLLTVENMDQVLQLIEKGMRISEVAQLYGTSNVKICEVLAGTKRLRRKKYSC